MQVYRNRNHNILYTRRVCNQLHNYNNIFILCLRKVTVDCFLYKLHEYLETQYSLVVISKQISLRMFHWLPTYNKQHNCNSMISVTTFPVMGLADAW